MPPYRSVIGLLGHSRRSLSVARRFKSTLEVPEFQSQQPVNTRNVDYLDRVAPNANRSHRANLSPPVRKIRLDSLTSAMIKEIEVGKMSVTMLAQAKGLLVECCKKGKPHLATDLLRRLVDEYIATTSDNHQFLGLSMFNMVISAWGSCGDVEKAEQVFSLMQQKSQQHPSLFPSPDVCSYNALMGAWKASNLNLAKDRVLQIFQEMEDSERIQPDAYSYNIVLSSYARRASEYGAAQAAEDFLLKFSDRHVKGLLDEGPGVVSFNIVMKAWSNCEDERGVERAKEIFALMTKLHAEGHKNVKPDQVSLLAVMANYSIRGDVDAIEEFFRQNLVDGDLTNCYNALISCYGNSKRPDAGEHAERILAEMSSPNEKTYSVVLKAHAHADRPDAANQCEDFLGRTLENYLKLGIGVRPNKEHFHIVLKAWQHHSDAKEATERALALLRDMESLSKSWMLQLKPDSTTFSLAIINVARVNAQMASELIHRAHRSHWILDISSYEAVLTALTVQPTKESIETAEAILTMMEEHLLASRFSYNILLHGFLRMHCPSYKLKSLDLMHRMERDGRIAVNKRPNMKTYVAILRKLGQSIPCDDDARIAGEIFSRMHELHRNPQSSCKLDLAGHSSYLKILSQVKSVYCAEKANEFFEMMQSKDYPVALDSFCTSRVIYANARVPVPRFTYLAHKHLLHSVQQFIEGRSDILPQPECFTTVLGSWSRSQERCKVDKAAELIQAARQLRDAGLHVASLIAELYSSFFDLLSKAYHISDAKAAEKILEDFVEHDIRRWSVVLRAWSRSEAADKAVQTRRLLLKIRDTVSAPMPDRVCHNAVLNAVAFSTFTAAEEKLEGLALAHETFNELQMSEHNLPDSVSFGTMIMCLRYHMEPSVERTAAIFKLVESCKAVGFVGLMVIRELEKTLSVEDFKELLGDGADQYITAKDTSRFQREWSRSVSLQGDRLYSTENSC